MMGRLKEACLNGLLMVLVVSSVALSAQVWFPSEHVGLTRAKGPRVQPPPPAQEGTAAPDFYRPERIYVKRKDGWIALLPSGSKGYQQLWHSAHALLSTVHINGAPAQIQEKPPDESEEVVLVLPIALTLAEWAEQWQWNTDSLRNASMKIDRIVFLGGKSPAVDLTGPSGISYRLSSLSQSDLQTIDSAVATVDKNSYMEYRPITLKDSAGKTVAESTAPDIKAVPSIQVVVRKLDNVAEEARYFPDLSVVRRIDEKDARSFTDGQRLLRLTQNGIVEFRMATPPGATSGLTGALSAAQEWVDAHGGWPQELVLSSYSQQPGRSTLGFELRGDGPYPVESSGGAMQVVVAPDRTDATASLIAHFKRFPDFTMTFGASWSPVISAEKALQTVLADYPQLVQSEPVRDIHIAYQITANGSSADPGWLAEPAWVIQLGENRVYVPASPDRSPKPVSASH